MSGRLLLVLTLRCLHCFACVCVCVWNNTNVRAAFRAGFKLLFKCRMAPRGAVTGGFGASAPTTRRAVMRHKSVLRCTRVQLLGHANLVLGRAASAVARAVMHV